MTAPAAMLDAGKQTGMGSDKKGAYLTSALFKVDWVDGSSTFSELAGINSEIEQAEYMEVGNKGAEYGRFFGKAKPPTITLKRAMSAGDDTTKIWAWHQLARAGLPSGYKSATFQLFAAGQDIEKDTALLSYTLVNAFPTKLEIASMKAGGTEVVLQTVTLQCDEIISSK
jgi:phage tail-like protein